MAVTKDQTRKMNQEILARALAKKAAKLPPKPPKVKYMKPISKAEIDVIKARAQETARKALEIARERADRERGIRAAHAAQKAKDRPDKYGIILVPHYKNP